MSVKILCIKYSLFVTSTYETHFKKQSSCAYLGNTTGIYTFFGYLTSVAHLANIIIDYASLQSTPTQTSYNQTDFPVLWNLKSTTSGNKFLMALFKEIWFKNRIKMFK